MGRGYQLFAILVGLDGHECVVVVACRVAFREVEASKHMPVVVQLARLFYYKTHPVKDVRYLLDLDHKRMTAAGFGTQQARTFAGRDVNVKRCAYIDRR